MLTLDDARRVVDAALAKAADTGVPSNVAVVDAGGNLSAFARMDGAWLGSISIAQDKAFTARAFDMTTEQLGSMSQDGQPLNGIASTNGGRVVIFAGGVPLVRDGEVVGAVGSSGGTPPQDAVVAQAGADAL